MKLKTLGLSAAFILAADMAMAATTGMVGIHGFVVEGGASLGQELGIPQVDWTHLWEEWEFSVIDPSIVENCVADGGHLHGTFCHYGADAVAESATEQIAQLPPTPAAAPAAAPAIDSAFD